jgi:hypothetical protein
MAPIESKHDVRRKVRDAQAQVNRDRLKRESDNREDMVAFLVAEQKLSAVNEWEAERHAHVRLEAEQRRAEQRLEGARALARMRDRGETVADIAHLGGCSVKLVRRYLKELQAAAPVSGTASGKGSRARGSDGSIGFDWGDRRAAKELAQRKLPAGEAPDRNPIVQQSLWCP